MLFIQQLGYTNTILKKVQLQENLNDSWVRWIGKNYKRINSVFPLLMKNLIL